MKEGTHSWTLKIEMIKKKEEEEKKEEEKKNDN
jgi:hypothetical protein